MRIRLEARHSANARQLARLHALISTARMCLGEAATLHDKHVHPLLASSQDRLIDLARALSGAVYSLEQPFLDRVGRDGPLAAPSDPECWTRWLDARAGKGAAE